MSAKKLGGLGRGFDSLIPTELLDESFDPTALQDDQVSELRMLKLEQITPDPGQPRRHFDEAGLDELAQSIATHGVIQPIIVAPTSDGYVIVAGERRYRAAKLAGLDKIPGLVRTLSDQHKLELSLIENLQRRDLNIMETATAYLKLRDQFNLTLDIIGQRVGGRSVSAISNTLRLLRLPTSVQTALVDGDLREGQARPLIGQPEEIIDQILPQIIKEQWSARKIEQFIVQLKRQASGEKPTVADATERPHAATLERIEHRLKAPITINTNTRGAGQIVIRFKNAREFERIGKLLDGSR